MIKYLFLLIFTLAFITACDQNDGAAESAGESIDNAVQEVENTDAANMAEEGLDAVEDAADAAMDMAEDSMDAAGEAMDDAMDAVEDAVDEVQTMAEDMMEEVPEAE